MSRKLTHVIVISITTTSTTSNHEAGRAAAKAASSDLVRPRALVPRAGTGGLFFGRAALFPTARRRDRHHTDNARLRRNIHRSSARTGRIDVALHYTFRVVRD